MSGRTLSYWLRISLCILSLLSIRAWAGNTTCASSQLDWYTSVVGETPCMTYQRLRQICNREYQVPSFKSTVPGDTCDDQKAACCCNTIAFQLSMLCMNCQQDRLAGNQPGIDAREVGTYTVYRDRCGPGMNKTLQDDIQRAVCNGNIKLEDNLYRGWSDGTWFYVNWKETVEIMHAAENNNTFTHCANQTSPSSTPTPAGNTASSSGNTYAITMTDPLQTTTSGSGSHDGASSSPSGGIIAGGIVGGVLVILAALVGALCWRRCVRRRHAAMSQETAAHPSQTTDWSSWGNRFSVLPADRASYDTATRHTGAGARSFSTYRPWESASDASSASSPPVVSAPVAPLGRR